MEEAQEKMAFFGLSLEPEGLYLLLVSLDWRELKAAPDIESRELEHLSVMETMAAASGSSRNSLLVELADGGIVVLMNAEESERAVVFAAAERIREGLLAAHGLEGTVGIGGYCDSVRDLPRAFREAKEALNYRKFAGGSVVYTGDIRMESVAPAPYPKEKEISLILSIKNGDENQATRIFRDFAQEVCTDPAHASFTEVQQIFLILLVRLMETARELSIDGKEMLPDREPVFAVFLKKTEWRSMLEWFEGLIRAMTSRIEDAFEQKNNKHVERAKNILETECGEASLTMVAERLNLNPAYLSRIFKEHSGITFTDFLNKERIRRSQKLLLETDLLVQEISSRLGYSQVNSFIKLFKAMTGFTPSEYRKNRG
ncbi:helix-turn-helix domain-containing protein [Paenibacillus sp. CC-CFT747]|nr:helix-turn-helix domain-containing protein [Paenibacillus sp. CC-CFT747]